MAHLEIVAGWIFAICVDVISFVILALGAWILINDLIWNVLIKKAFSWTIYYKRLFYYLFYYNEIKAIIGNKADNLFKEEEQPPC